MTEKVWTAQQVEDGHISSLERAKFTRDDDGKVTLRTLARGEIRPSGLTTGGKITIQTVTDTWTALPLTALTDRNAICIQNRSGSEIKINYDNTVVGYVGVVVPDKGERYYNITDSIVIYARTSSGSADVTVEEIA